jgi:hypothetical protein
MDDAPDLDFFVAFLAIGISSNQLKPAEQ